ncbi:hypothetical protein N6H13_10375 [Paenibacillus sp. CC-CFT742]|nr:hypothetical protein [Paenibacillus sp. CC-CFT742]WJH30943.1 hypothetical protein N6H13_10375 [Paenibacillus sp. CC-CFT742]
MTRSKDLATGSGRDGIDSEEAIAVAFVSEFQTFEKINQENLETTAIGRTIRIWNGHVPTWYVFLGGLIDNQLNLATWLLPSTRDTHTSNPRILGINYIQTAIAA